jgi:hypothetical protein
MLAPIYKLDHYMYWHAIINDDIPLFIVVAENFIFDEAACNP